MLASEDEVAPRAPSNKASFELSTDHNRMTIFDTALNDSKLTMNEGSGSTSTIETNESASAS